MKFIHILILCLFFVNIVIEARRSYGGTYSYVNKNTHRTHYVGATNNFDRRHNEHKNAGHYYTGSNYQFKKNHMPHSTSEERYQEERNQIRRENPVANKYAGGNGRR